MIVSLIGERDGKYLDMLAVWEPVQCLADLNPLPLSNHENNMVNMVIQENRANNIRFSQPAVYTLLHRMYIVYSCVAFSMSTEVATQRIID